MKCYSNIKEIYTMNNHVSEVIDAYEEAILAKFPRENIWLGRDGNIARFLAHLPEPFHMVQSAVLRWAFGDPEMKIL